MNKKELVNILDLVHKLGSLNLDLGYSNSRQDFDKSRVLREDIGNVYQDIVNLLLSKVEEDN